MTLHGTHGHFTVILDIRVFHIFSSNYQDIYCVTMEVSLHFSHERIEVYRGKFEHPTLNPLAEQTLYRTAPPKKIVGFVTKLTLM